MTKKRKRVGSKLGYKNPYEQSYIAAKQELQALEEEATLLEERKKLVAERLELIKSHLRAIEPLVQHDPGLELVQIGLAQICRKMLERYPSWFTPQQVKNRLELAGVDLQGYTNPMAVLHAVLKRVGDSFKGKDGTVYYGKRGLEPKEPEKDAGIKFVAPDPAWSNSRISVNVPSFPAHSSLNTLVGETLTVASEQSQSARDLYSEIVKMSVIKTK